MKYFYTLFSALFLALCITSGVAVAEEEVVPRAEDILLLYDFTAQEGSNPKFGYFSRILPDTTAKTLSTEPNLRIERRKEPLPFVESTYKREELQPIVGELKSPFSERGGEKYIATGTYSVTGEGAARKLVIEMQIINEFGGSVETFSFESTELGARLSDTTDVLSQMIRDQISIFIAKNDPLYIKPSPYKPFYEKLRGLSFGFSYGFRYPLSDFSDVYNDTRSVHPYMMFATYKKISFSLGYEYMAYNSNGKNITNSTSFEFLAGRSDIHFRFFNPSEYLNMTAHIGGGMGYSIIKITSGTGSPFDSWLNRGVSWDPYGNAGIRLNIILHPLQIHAGTEYSRIFYTGTDFQSLAYTIGVTWRL